MSTQTQLVEVKSELNSRIINGFNHKFFNVEEFSIVQDALDATNNLQEVDVVMKAHHSRLHDAFEKSFTDNLKQALVETLH